MFELDVLTLATLEGWQPAPEWQPVDVEPPPDTDGWWTCPPPPEDETEPDERPPDADELPSVWAQFRGARLAQEISDTAAQLAAGAAGAALAAEIVEGCERLISWAHAQQSRAIVTLADRLDADPGIRAARREDHTTPLTGEDLAAGEIGPLLSLSPRTAQSRVQLAADLVRQLPASWQALSDGHIDVARARVLADDLTEIDPALARRVEAKVLPAAGGQTAPALRRSIARALHTVHPKNAQDRHREALTRRSVDVFPNRDGMCSVIAYLSAVDAMTVRSALDGLAAATDGDGRTADQRRADAFADIFRSVLDRPDLPTHHRRRPHLQVTVAATTLAGLDDDPAELADYGSITADVARELAGDAIWRRLLTDRAGTVIDVGTTTYEPPAALARLVLARDGTCRWPGCNRAAERCDIDHRVPFPRGSTTADNLITLCRRHHRLKHEGGWQVDVRPDDPELLAWTSPTGRTYTTRPNGPPPPTTSPPTSSPPTTSSYPDEPPF